MDEKMDKDNQKIKSEQDKLLYEEAWRQYEQEDKLFEERNKTYLSIVTTLLSVFSLICGVVSLCSDLIGHKKEVYIIIGCILIALLVGFWAILCCWNAVTDAARDFISYRFKTIQNIEKSWLSKKERMHGIAIVEGIEKQKVLEMKKKELGNKNKNVSDDDVRKKFVGSFKAIKRVIVVFKIITIIAIVFLLLAMGYVILN